MTTHSELIERLNKVQAILAKYGLAESATCITEAATALQYLTSTIAGLEVDAEWLDYLCMYANSEEIAPLMESLSFASSPEQWRELIENAIKNGVLDSPAISRSRG